MQPVCQLVLVGTPLAHPDDLGLRARSVLATADLLICEDRKTAARLFRHHGLSFPGETFRLLNEHTGPEEFAALLDLVVRTPLSVLISDAGMPVLADPGGDLVRAARAAGVIVSVVPGPTAATTALARAGLGSNGFFFAGFCPRKPQERLNYLAKLVQYPFPVVLYEAPYRIRALLQAVHAVFPAGHRLYLGVDLTGESEFELDCFCKEIPRIVDHIPKGPPVVILYSGKDDVIQKESACRS